MADQENQTFSPIAVPSTGETTAPAFLDYADGTGEFAEHTWKTFPASPRGEAFRAAREATGLGFGGAGRLLGLTPLQVCGLETGKFVFATETEWAAAEAVLSAAGARS